MADPVKPKHKRPSKAEMEERLVVPLTPEELAEGLLQAGPDPQDEKVRGRARERSGEDD